MSQLNSEKSSKIHYKTNIFLNLSGKHLFDHPMQPKLDWKKYQLF